MHPLADLLDSHTAGYILDVGTRYGDFIRTVVEYAYATQKAVGIDIDIDSLAIAKKNSIGTGISFLAASVDSLPFDAGTFDTVVMSNALHHLPDIESGLSEMLRVLKPNGLFLIAEYICDNPTAAQGSFTAMHDLGGDIARHAGISHHRFFCRDEVMQIMDTLRLEHIETQSTEPPSENHDPAIIQSRADTFFTHLEKIAGTPEYDRYQKAVITARLRAIRTGIQLPPQLLFAGRKRIHH